MTNEKAIQVIKEKAKGGEQPERLAAMYAMDDIVTDDIDTWLNTDVSEYLMQFPDIARDLANDLIEEGVTKSKLAAEAGAERVGRAGGGEDEAVLLPCRINFKRSMP